MAVVGITKQKQNLMQARVVLVRKKVFLLFVFALKKYCTKYFDFRFPHARAHFPFLAIFILRKKL